MKSPFFQLIIIILVVGCNSNSKSIKIEENKNIPYSKIEIGAFPRSKSTVFKTFGFPHKVSGEKWEYYNVKGLALIEYNFQSCCEGIRTLTIKKAKTNLETLVATTHIDCNNGLNDTIK